MTNLSIKTVVLAAIVGLQVLAAAIIISASSLSSGQAVLQQSRQLMINGIEQTERNIRDLLHPVEAALRISKNLYENDILVATDDHVIERYFFEQLSASPKLSGVYHGSEAGDFTYVSRSTDRPGADFRTKLMSRSAGQSGASLVYRDAGFREIMASTDQQDTYDPRLRPWYRDAMRKGDVIWTDPYIFYTSRKPGITVAAPVQDRDGTASGVIGFDLKIETLSGFLADLDISENSAALLMATNGNVIAHSHRMTIETSAEGDETKPRFARIDEIDDPVAHAAVNALGGSIDAVDFAMSQFARIETEGSVYNIVFEPIEIGGLTWVLGVYTPETDILGWIVASRYRNIGLAVVITLVAILIGWVVAHYITKPMTSLSVMADRITHHKRLDANAMPGGLAEVQDVSTALLRLTEWLDDYRTRNDGLNRELLNASHELEIRVEERTNALRSANDRLRLEVVERAEAERKLAVEMRQHRRTAQDLEVAFRQAHDASRAKSLFLSGMSHELRTPLNAIIGFSQVLQGEAGPIPEERRAEYMGYILSSGERLLGLINEVLDLAQVESGKILLSIEAVDARRLIANVVTETGIIAEDTGITLIDETKDRALPCISADPKRLTQCIVNLVVNAIKYNRPGGSVRISASRKQHCLRIAIADTGIGIPQQRQAEVFETFNRLGAENSTVQGSGIGLALTREFIEKMGGTVSFESIENEGSTFWLEIPLRDRITEDRTQSIRNSA